MCDYTMFAYGDYRADCEPNTYRYTGDLDGAIKYAKDSNSFEVDIYEGMRREMRRVCTVTFTGEVIYDE